MRLDGTTFGIAEAAQRATTARLEAYARAPGVDVQRGPGWFAVRTGVDSNDLNGVVSEPGAGVSAPLVGALCAWFAASAVPACWEVTRPDPELTSVLVAAGARPERTGVWSGRPLGPDRPPPEPGVEVRRVRDDADLDAWLDVALDGGWCTSPQDRRARRQLYAAVGLDHRGLRHWLALDRGRPVGFATSFLDGAVVDLVSLGVAAGDRRRGVGRALVAARLADAAAEGARFVVSAPSDDGWQLQRTLGFRTEPVVPDTCFYLPSRAP